MSHSSVDEQIVQAGNCPHSEISGFLHAVHPRILAALLTNPALTENEIVLLLNRKNLPQEIVEQVANDSRWVLHYAVKAALVKHPKTPIQVSLDLIKFLFPFDLVSVSLQPAIRHEVQAVAENLILSQFPQLAVGQKTTLARRATARIAAELLTGENLQIIEAALNNPRLTEKAVIQSLNGTSCSQTLVDAVASHRKWSQSYGARLALLRTKKLSMAKALAIVPLLKSADLKDLVEDSRVDAQFREYIKQLGSKQKA